jgi:hypothetical protein
MEADPCLRRPLQESAVHALTRFFAAGLCAAAAASAAHAQQRSVRPVPNTIPSASARAAAAAPNPAGLRPLFPAGISSGSGARQSTDPIAASTAPVAPSSTDSTPTGNFGSSVNLAPELGNFNAVTNVMGAGAGNTVAGPAQRNVGGAGGYSAVDQARSFYFADANHDGELTRAEARRLSIATMSFEEMDRNFDQIISRFEYEDSLR